MEGFTSFSNFFVRFLKGLILFTLGIIIEVIRMVYDWKLYKSNGWENMTNIGFLIVYLGFIVIIISIIMLIRAPDEDEAT